MAWDAKYWRFLTYSSGGMVCGVMLLLASMPSIAPQSAFSMMAWR
jgi:hypothetical protein